MNFEKRDAERLFEAARQLTTPQERAAFLQIACTNNPELRRRVEDLLEAEAQAGAFLEDVSQVSRSVASTIIVVTEKPGDMIGRYKLLEQIGEGGCGVVYVAEQSEPVRRRVALKIVKLGMETKQVIARFEAERQALALMDHPNIAKVFDAGATDTGRSYFVMELVKGLPITKYCDENKLDAHERLNLFVKICQAIQHAHQKGIIHRDIKPSNVLVADHDGVAVPKVIDFGIAKAITDQRLTDKTLYTALEQFIGTPAYMSPEQARLSGLDIDTRSDIYSLGVLLYELLTGQTPFDVARLMEAGLDEIRRIIREEEPPRPSMRLSTLDAANQTMVASHRHSDPQRLLGLLRGDLDWIVMKCLEKDRARRYQTANGVGADVKRHLDNEPILAAAPSTFYTFSKFVRRHRAVSGAVLALTIGFVVSSWLFVRERAEKGRADQQSDIIETISHFLVLERSSERNPFESGIQPSPGTSVVEELSKTAANIGDKFRNRPILEANFRELIGNAYCKADVKQPALAIAQYEQVIALRKAVQGPDHADTIASMKSLSQALRDSGRSDEAIALDHEILKRLQAKFGPAHQEVISCMFMLGHTYEEQTNLVEAIANYEKALQLKKANPEGDWGWLQIIMQRLAGVYEKNQEILKAEAILREELSLDELKSGTNSTIAASVMERLGKCLLEQQKYPEAEQTIRKCLAIREEENPGLWGTLKTRSLLGECILDQKRFSEAERFLRSSYEGMKELEESEMTFAQKDTMGKALQRLVRLYDEWGKPDQAEKWKRTLAEFDKSASQANARNK